MLLAWSISTGNHMVFDQCGACKWFYTEAPTSVTKAGIATMRNSGTQQSIGTFDSLAIYCFTHCCPQYFKTCFGFGLRCFSSFIGNTMFKRKQPRNDKRRCLLDNYKHG